MKISEKGISLIKRFESLHDGDLRMIGLQPKLCPAGLWTEGYGSLVLDEKGRRISGVEHKDKAYQYSKISTAHDAELALRKDLRERESMVNSLNLSLTQGQFDALVSFTYNVGFTNLKASTLLKKTRANTQDPSIRNEFMKWRFANKKELRGLKQRREDEANLYFS